MRVFWKYFFGLLMLGILIIFYFLKTDYGHENLKYIIENYLSKKTNSKIEVHSLNLEKYPHVSIELEVNKKATVILKGTIGRDNMNMYYHLRGDSVSFNDFYLEDNIDVQGTLFGLFSSLQVRGYGKVFDGEVKYNFIDTPKEIQSMNIEMKKVDSQKVLKFLEQKSLLKGSVNIDAHFNLFSKYKKEGQAKIHMNKAFISQVSEELPFVLNSTIEFNNMDYRYKGNIHSYIVTMKLNNGYYDKSRQLDNANYEIYIKDLSFFEKALKGKYQGALDLNGTIVYDNHSKVIVIKGQTAEFGGDLSYVYKNNNIDFKLKAVSLENLLTRFSYPILFSSSLYGKINFDIKEKILLIDTELKKTHFKHTKLVDIIYSKLKIDMMASIYDKSYFLGGYKDSILSSTLKIGDGENYLYLTDTKMNILTNSIHSKFEMKLQGKEIYGEIYGTLEEPKVWINKSKFLKYETEKHFGSWLGTTK